MSQFPKDIFQPIHDKEFLQSLYSELAQNHQELQCKPVTQDEALTVIVQNLDRQNHLHVTTKHQFKQLPMDVIVLFEQRGEKYFLSSQLKEGTNQQLLLSLQNQLYHLQRRQNYRLRIPDSYKTSASIQMDDSSILKGTIIDFSSGGCRVGFGKQKLTLQDSTFQNQKKMQVTLQLGSREVMKFPVRPKHFLNEVSDYQFPSIGLQFELNSPALETKLFGLTMELYRELYVRKNP